MLQCADCLRVSMAHVSLARDVVHANFCLGCLDAANAGSNVACCIFPAVCVFVFLHASCWHFQYKIVSRAFENICIFSRIRILL